MRVEFDARAIVELGEALAYYDEQRLGLGGEFLDEVNRGLERILAHPTGWQSLSRRSRRYRLDRFPYGLVYQPRNDLIVILALMHLKRRPRYWRSRENE